jgi:hypothetical protein
MKIAISDRFCPGNGECDLARRFRESIVANPGSLGQPKHGNSRASYAIWDTGIELRSDEYAVSQTIAKIERIPIASHIRAN